MISTTIVQITHFLDFLPFLEVVCPDDAVLAFSEATEGSSRSYGYLIFYSLTSIFLAAAS